MTEAEVRALEGGTDAWHAFGRPLVKDRTNPPDEACVDSYLRPYDRNAGVEEAMRPISPGRSSWRTRSRATAR